MKLIPAEPGRNWPFNRVVLAVVMLVGLTLVGPVLAADGATVSVGDYDVSRGESFTVMVEVEGGVDVAGYSFELGFNPAVLEVQSVTVGDFLGAAPWFTGASFDNTLGTVKVEASLEPPFAAGGVDGDGVLAEIEMEAVGAGLSALTFASATLYDSESDPQAPTLDHGTVTSRAAMKVSAHPEKAVGLGPFTETVMLLGGEDVAGYRVTVRSSDPSVVAIEDVELGPFLEDGSDLVANVNKTVDAGEATIQVAGTPPGAEPVDGATGDGVIVIVHLNGLAVGDSMLTLEERAVYDTDAVEFVPGALNGLVHVTDVEMSVLPAETTLFVTQEFDVDIHVDEDAEDVASYKFSLHWDPEYFTVTQVVDTGFLGGVATTNLTKDAEAGWLTFEAFLAPPLTEKPDGPGDLATVTFEAIGEGTSDLNLHDALIYSGSLEVPAVTVDGEATAILCVDAEITALTATPNPVMVGETVVFSATVTGSVLPAHPMVYTWDFGDGSPTETGSDSATHVYDDWGSFTASLTAANWCGTDEEEVAVTVEAYTNYLPIIVKNYGP